MNSRENESVRALLQELISSGEETGLQVATYHRGRLVIDTWAGVADARTARAVDGDTLFTVFSTTKGITCTAIHILAERGLLRYDDPVSRFWPDFAVNGKAGITVRHVLTHMSGVPQMPEGATPESVCDWHWICSAIARLSPLWKPGTLTGYHSYTMGWILGEVLRRIDGRPIARFIRDEICSPLGTEDIYLGIPDAVEGRVAWLEDAPPPPGAPPRTALSLRAAPDSLPAGASLFNRPDIRRCSFPAAGGIMTARALALHYAALATGVSGVRLLPPERVALIGGEQTRDLDQVIGLRVRKGMGYFLHGENGISISESPDSFGHPGAGGSVGYADPFHGLAVGFAKTRLNAVTDPHASAAARVTAKIREVLGIS